MESGKSCLTHLIIEHIREILQQATNQRLAFFYCDGTDQQGSSAMSDSDKVMGSLVKQLTLQRGIVHKAVFDAYERMHNNAQLTAIECVDLIVEISSQSQITFIVFDGYDECSIDVQRTLAMHLQDLIQKARTTIRLFISSRPSVEPRLRGWIHDEINVRGNNLKDLSVMVREKVLSAANRPEFKSLYWKGEDCRTHDIIAVLEKHAQGMFRWVQLALGYLHKSQHYSAMTRRLQTLPKSEDLLDLYAAIWDSAIAAADEEDRKAMKILVLFAMYGLEAPAFRWAGDKHMDPFLGGMGHVAFAADFITDPTTSQTNTSATSLSDLARLCPDFVEYEEIIENAWPNFTNDVSKLRLQHVSVREFFVARHEAEYSPASGHAFLAWLCIEYWLEHATWLGFGYYGGANWGDYLLRVKSLAQDDLETYLKEDFKLQRAVTAFLGGKTPSEPFTKWSKWMQDNHGYVYLITCHAASSWTAIPLSTTFARIELDLPIEELDEDALRAKQQSGLRSGMLDTLQFAHKVGNVKALEYLKSKGFY